MGHPIYSGPIGGHGATGGRGRCSLPHPEEPLHEVGAVGPMQSASLYFRTLWVIRDPGGSL
jgi:hypothetical protein